MQKLAREYLDELNKRHKKNRRALVAWILMAVLVVGGVMGTLAQYGVAFEGSPECGKEEHTHDDGCYTETRELTCDLAEGEEHTHDDVCYTVSKELACELEEHSHEAGCYVEESKPDDTPQPNKTTPAESNGNTENPENPPVVTDKDTEPEDPQNPSAGTDDVTTPEDPQNPPAGTDDVMTPEDPQNPPTDTDDVTTPEDTQNPSDGTENGTEEGTVPDDSVETGTVSGNEVEAEFPPFEEKYSDDQVVITVSAEEGVIPAGAELKVVPVVKQDVEELEGQRNVAAEEIETAKEINDKYDAAAEKLEELAAEDETKNIAGFLAYDISFIVTDENGESIEIEPNSENGNVSVKMEFAKALLPEELANKGDVPIGSVDVIHMKEDGKELKAEVLENAEVSTTENAEVEKAEFVVDSFSVFVITWNQIQLILNQVDTLGNWLDNTLKFVTWSESVIDFTQLDKLQIDGKSLDKVEIEGKTYTFVKAVLSEDLLHGTLDTVPSITKVYLDNSSIKYLKEGQECETSQDLSIHLVYSDGVSELIEANTIDSTSKGVDLYIKNYPFDKELLSFLGGNYGGEKVTQGLVDSKLGEDGFPVTSANAPGKNKSLAGWFDGATQANQLFLESEYNNDKTFYYSSFKNYARFNEETKEFKVYDNIIGVPARSIGTSEIAYKRGNFFPYSNLGDNITVNWKEDKIDENGNSLPEGSQVYHIPDKDFHFSMWLKTDFIQGKDGKIDNGKDMIYEFNGDDDLWVFIDDVLVLDIGGIHRPLNGSINFNTGEVHVEGVTNSPSMKERFEEAGKYNQSEWVEYAPGKFRFKDYSSHTLKMFYMERNAQNYIPGSSQDSVGASTLKMSFNLPTIQEDEIRVTKELTGTAQAQYASTDFEFLVQVKEDGVWKAINQTKAYSNEAYIQGTAADIEVTNGRFKLKAGESAWFKGLQKDLKYRVIEIGSVGINPDGNTDYFVTDTINTTYKEIDDKGISIKGVATEEKTVGTDKFIVFTNECTERAKGELQITKEMNGTSAEAELFKIKVWMKKNEAGVVTWEPYTGDYYITGGSGQAKDSPLTTSDGTVLLSVGQTATIKDVVAGTVFYVEEIELDSKKYDTPQIEAQRGTADELEDDKPTGAIENGYAGVMKRDDVQGTITAKVTVTNTSFSSAEHGLQVTKQLEPNATNPGGSEPFAFRIWKKAADEKDYSIYNGEYSIAGESETKMAGDGLINIFAGQTVKIDSLPSGTSFVVEEILPENSLYGKPQATVDGKEQTIADSELKEQKYIYTVATGTIQDAGYMDVVVTNVLKPTYAYDWQIVKKGSVEGTPVLGNARFTLTPSEQNKTKADYSGISDQDTGVIEWFDSKNNPIEPAKMETGTYILGETEAPIGYAVSGEEWIVELDYEKITISRKDFPALTYETKTLEDGKEQYVWTFLNEAAYELPSTGGSGIYRYMISGVLLMLAGVLILYNNKRARRCAGV